MSALEKVIYVAGAMVACLAGLSPAALWRFPVVSVPEWIFPLAVCVALCVALTTRASQRVAQETAEMGDETAEHFALDWPRRIVIVLVAATLLWLLRSRTLYGDAKAIIGFIDEGVLFHKREPLSPTLFFLAHIGVGDELGWTPQFTIQVVNTLAGAVGIVTLLGIARRIAGVSRVHRMAASAALIGCGAVQLFAGYIENYTVPTVCMLGCIVCSLDAFAGRRRLIRAVGLWTLSCMFHLAALAFTPAILWLVWKRRDRFRVAMIATTGRLLAVTLLPALFLYGLMLHFGVHRAEEKGFGGGDGLMLVPIFDRTGMSQYLLFRPAHLLAIANEQLLVAPLGIVMAATGTIAALWRGRWRTWRQDGGLPSDAHIFLLLAATGFLALTMVWNPDLGPLRDWDLFGPVGFYLNICGVALLCHYLRSYPARTTAILLFVTVVNLSRALPFVLHNAVL